MLQPWMLGRGIFNIPNPTVLGLFVPPSHPLSPDKLFCSLILIFLWMSHEESRNWALSAVDNYSSSRNSFLFVNAYQVPPSERWYRFGKGIQIRECRTISSPQRSDFLSFCYHIKCSPWLTIWVSQWSFQNFRIPFSTVFQRNLWLRLQFIVFSHCSWLFFIFLRWNSACLFRCSVLQSWEGRKTPATKGKPGSFLCKCRKNASQNQILKLS